MNEYGLALGGGGAKGSYEIGVWKALRELEIPIGFVTGTSVGALNGALIVQNDFNLAYQLWTEITIEKVISIANKYSFRRSNKDKYTAILNTIGKAFSSGGLDIGPLRRLLDKNIDETKIRESSTGFGIVTFSLSELKPTNLYKEEIPSGKLIDYLLASSCLPVFKPQTLDKNVFIDGAFCDVIPVSLLADKGVRDIIAVDISSPGIMKKVVRTGTNIINIKNSHSLGGMLEFNIEKAKLNMEIGYYDTLRKFGRLKGKRYYFIPNQHVIAARERYLKTLTPEDFMKIYKFLGLEWSDKPNPMNKLIIYKIMQTISLYADGKLSAESVLPAMLEITAEQLGIAKRNTYSFDTLISDILYQYNNLISSTDYLNYKKEITEYIINKKGNLFFDKEFRKKLTNVKFLAFYTPDFNQNYDKIKYFRRFMAVAFTRTSIANMCISLLLSR